MPLKKHHKIMIGGFSTFLIGILIANSVFIYILYGQLQLSYNQIEANLNELQADTQSKFNELTENLIANGKSLESLGAQVGTIDEKFAVLKASAGADFSDIIDNAIKSVVTIKTDLSQGTGFLIDERGYIVTNYHVMENAKAAGVYTYDGTDHQVSLIGYNANFDVALLRIEGTYKDLELADSDDIQIGEKVIAIGNPLGLQFSVSEGIISATNREGINNENVYIQTDAALNPGNSGGPLINTDGEVIGINNFKISDGESLGFALESNYIKDVVNEIAENTIGGSLI